MDITYYTLHPHLRNLPPIAYPQYVMFLLVVHGASKPILAYKSHIEEPNVLNEVFVCHTEVYVWSDRLERRAVLQSLVIPTQQTMINGDQFEYIKSK